jgi:hypothetical protein
MSKKCRCIIRHPTSPKERKQVVKALEYARRDGDSLGIIVNMAALTGKCPAKLRICK